MRQSLFTFLNRCAVAAINFLILIATARYFGAEGRGIISIFILNLTIVSMASNFIGGPGLVYLFSRNEHTRLFSASYLWAFISSIAVSLIMSAFSLVQSEYLMHLIILSFLQSLTRIQSSFFLSENKIKEYNFTALIFPAVVLVFLYLAIEIYELRNVEQFFIGAYIGLILNLVISSVLVYKNNNPLKFSFRIKKEFQDAFKLGFIIQAANIFQLLNYRFSFFLVDHYHGKEQVGIYSAAISIAETIWLISNSFATIQYAKISQSKNDADNLTLTKNILHLVIIVTIIALIGLLLVPGSFFALLLGKEFEPLSGILPYLAPGIFLLVYSVHIIHYYSGSGNPYMGLICSAAGLIITTLAGFFLVPAYGIKGASLTTSLSYAVASLVCVILFIKQKNQPVSIIVPSLKKMWRTRRNLNI